MILTYSRRAKTASGGTLKSALELNSSQEQQKQKIKLTLFNSFIGAC